MHHSIWPSYVCVEQSCSWRTNSWNVSVSLLNLHQWSFVLYNCILRVAGLAAWRSGNRVGRINEVTLRRARLVLGWVTVSGFDSRRQNFISVCNQPPSSTQLFILSRSINWVVSCNRMFASSHRGRHLVNAYVVKAWCGWLGRWCVL